MASTSLSPVMQQRIAVIVPIIALLLSLFVVYPAWGRYGQQRTQIDAKKAQLQTLINTPLPPESEDPTAPDGAPEPPQFFAEIKAIAAVAGCRIVGYDMASGTGAPADDAESPIRAVRAKVELEATYPEIRAFLVELARPRRLYVVSNLEITANRPAPGTLIGGSTGPLRATVEIERYVSLPDTAEKPAS